jgi:ribose transport system permease protein
MAVAARARLARLSPPRLVRRHAWTAGVYLLLAAILGFTVAIHPSFGAFDVETVALAALPLGLAAAAQTVAVLAGGIDLSIGSLMAVANVMTARLMLHQSLSRALAIALLVLAVTTAAGTFNGVFIVLSRVPDIVATLATSFVWGGVALLILERPGGGAPQGFLDLATGSSVSEWLPNALIMLIVVVGVVWLPLRATRAGLGLYAVGSDRVAALGSGVSLGRSKVLSYTLSGLFSGVGGLALTMTTGIGSPLSGTYYTLSTVSAIVLGGVSLAGGRGGMLGPMAAAFVLALIPSDLIFLGVDPNYGQVIQGTLIVLVVMVGGLATLRRRWS